MTAVEIFHFDVQEYFMHTFQLPPSGKSHNPGRGEKKSLHWTKFLQDPPSVLMGTVSFLFLFVFVSGAALMKGNIFSLFLSPGMGSNLIKLP